MRHFDLEVIKMLETEYEWIVYYPLHLVAYVLRKEKKPLIFGKNGVIRKTCFDNIEKSDVVVAYTGLIWDTGTAREIEYAVEREKPVLAWSDSSLVFGETLGRKGVFDGKDFDNLFVRVMPFNGMDVVFDKFLELSTLYNYELTEEELAKKIHKEATKLLMDKT